MRHLCVFVVVYGVLCCLLPRMERELLQRAPSNALLYARLQNFGKIRVNYVKGACLACIWPFAVCAGPRVFVELGCFSMACFAIACRADADAVRRTTSKLFWHDFFRSAGIDTPCLVALSDAARRVRVLHDGYACGVRKPDLGMYGFAVRRDDLPHFCATAEPDEIFQEEILTSDGVPGRSYRLTTFLCARGARVTSLFMLALSNASIPPKVWRQLVEFGRSTLAPLHARRLASLPLVGWDLMHTPDGRVVALEGNPGGNLGMHLFPFASEVGAVPRSIAATWMADLQEAYALDVYARGAAATTPPCFAP